jgi:hypothetical protein
VERLERWSRGRNQKVALAATQLLLSYHSGRPEASVVVDVKAPDNPWTPEAMAFLTEADLAALNAIQERLSGGGRRPTTPLLAPVQEPDCTRARGNA